MIKIFKAFFALFQAPLIFRQEKRKNKCSRTKSRFYNAQALKAILHFPSVDLIN